MPMLSRAMKLAGSVATTLLCLIMTATAIRAEPAGDAPWLSGPHVEINGLLFRVEKLPLEADGVEEVRYIRGGRFFSRQELQDWLASQTLDVMSPALRHAVDGAAADQPIEAIIVLTAQPAAPIARQAYAQIRPQVEEHGRQAVALTKRVLQRPSLRPAEERAFVPPVPNDADAAVRRAHLAKIDDLHRSANIAAAKATREALRPSQDAFVARVRAHGGQVQSRGQILNMVGVLGTPSVLRQLAQDPDVARMDFVYHGEPELDVQKSSLGVVDGFWAAGVDGGVHDVGVLDTGVQQSHPSLSSHPFISNGGTTDPNGHGTGMAGILASTHETFTGMAFGCDTIVVSIAGNINVSMPGMDFIAGTGEPELVNYSFGNGTATDSDYSPTDQFFDGVIDTFGFMVSKSAGNGGYNPATLTITHPAPAYNLMASANIDDKNTITRADDFIYSTSSVGPTLSGRKKPDISAPGQNSMSCNPSGGFSNIGGTSAASPHTGGGIVLLRDLGLTDVRACKAVLLNTTDAITDNGTSGTGDDEYVEGSLWNRRYGWGHLNLGSAYQHGTDVFMDAVPDSPENADFRLFVGQMFPKERATLVWNRHVAYNGATFPNQIELLSNLNLYAYRESDNVLLSRSESLIDNVEQLHVEVEAQVVLKVEAFGSFDPDIEAEDFAIATQENFMTATGPILEVALDAPPTAPPGAEVVLSAEVTNNGDLTAHAVLVTLTDADIIDGPNPASLGSLASGGSAMAQWTVLTPLTPGEVVVSAGAESISYAEVFSGQATASYFVEDCLLGDVNADGLIDGQDVEGFVGVFLAPGEAGEGPFCASDVVVDGTIDENDLTAFVALLLQ